ncbi:MAG: hypothetical protein DIU78_023655, partial [Pseudomonadota bacterium]
AEHPYLSVGLGSDPVAWGALALAVGCTAAAFSPRIVERAARIPRRRTLGALAVLAALLSAGYVAHYLRGGPRIIDATSYWLAARAIAAGDFTFPVLDPEAAFRGRFLLSPGDASELGVVFPPGYPAILALGFVLGAPLAVGPVLAAALVFATYAVTRALGGCERAGLTAAGLSALCAALRYHTADTMSHGLSALLVAFALVLSARRGTAALAGAFACVGLLVATRPLTGVIAFLGVLLLALRHRVSSLVAIAAALPGIALYAAHQHAVTGTLFRTSHAAYYATADGPPGCFRWGLGAGIGCWFEHGTFVRAHLAGGYDLAAALGNTLRRLAVHALDIGNAAPLAALVLVGMVMTRGRTEGRVATLLVLGIIVGYAGFYFEGSYPGGGARLFADVLPIEHAFVALAATRLAIGRFVAPVALLGFALHTNQQHRALAEREGGRPMYEASVVRNAGIERGLVFVTTDHGFSLGHEPGQLDPAVGVVVARLRGDAIDRFLWERLGRPPSYRYDYDPGAFAATPQLTPFTPPLVEPARVEGEGLWPPLAIAGGFAHPDFSPHPCVSRRRGLRFRPTEGPTRATVVLPTSPTAGPPTSVVLGWVADQLPRVALRVPGSKTGEIPVQWAESPRGPCWRSLPVEGLPPDAKRLEIRAHAGILDYIEHPRTTPKSVDN